MVNIDTVYQRVLAISNKEQRGYITPLEFNLLANQAQMVLFEQYFYDLDKVKRLEGDDSSFSDMKELIKNKLEFFTQVGNVAGGTTFPANYRTGKIFLNGYEVKLMQRSDIRNILDSTFHRQGLTRDPVYVESEIGNQDVQVFDSDGQVVGGVTVEIIVPPNKAEWGYDVVGEKALHNGSPGRTFHFEVHESEETKLVLKILEQAGVIIEDPNLVQYANQKQVQTSQQEKQ
jgi:hypothetical protein|tara:strand:- start:130 stop:822 length:693 start_codon:yes stop_codon:yes gene_type:complete